MMTDKEKRNGWIVFWSIFAFGVCLLGWGLYNLNRLFQELNQSVG